MSGPDRAGIEGSREMRRESKALRAALLSWRKPRPTVPGRMRCRPGARFVFVVMCQRLGLARGGAGCQGGVRVVFLRAGYPGGSICFWLVSDLTPGVRA